MAKEIDKVKMPEMKHVAFFGFQRVPQLKRMRSQKTYNGQQRGPSLDKTNTPSTTTYEWKTLKKTVVDYSLARQKGKNIYICLKKGCCGVRKTAWLVLNE